MEKLFIPTGKVDYEALYENEASRVKTLQELNKRYVELLRDVKEHNYKFTNDQKAWLESHLFLVDELAKLGWKDKK